MQIEQKKYVILTKNNKIWTHRGFKNLDTFMCGRAYSEIYLFQTVSNAKSTMENLFLDPNEFIYKEVKSLISFE